MSSHESSRDLRRCSGHDGMKMSQVPVWFTTSIDWLEVWLASKYRKTYESPILQGSLSEYSSSYWSQYRKSDLVHLSGSRALWIPTDWNLVNPKNNLRGKAMGMFSLLHWAYTNNYCRSANLLDHGSYRPDPYSRRPNGDHSRGPWSYQERCWNNSINPRATCLHKAIQVQGKSIARMNDGLGNQLTGQQTDCEWKSGWPPILILQNLILLFKLTNNLPRQQHPMLKAWSKILLLLV